ncbi:MAG TPA: DNA-binding protein WhiA [Bacillota bacterium]|nr:DNA-binding protein WhiA [Bacillota bacterium]
MKSGKDTFSRTVKEELSRVEIAGPSQAFWEYYGLICLLGPNKDFEVSNGSPVVSPFDFQSSKDKVKPYLLRRMFYLDKNLLSLCENQPSLEQLKNNPEDRKAFLRGLFLARGYLSSPSNQHHLELVLPSEEMAIFVSSLLDLEGLKNAIIKRRGAHIVYMKNGDQISQFLTMLGASRSVLEYEQIRVRKTVRGSVQRQINMDKANLSRTVDSSLAQIADIELLDEEIGLNSLSPALREIAQARLDNPSLTMEELGQSLAPPISKSAVNHRLRRIAEKAESIKKGKPRGVKDTPEGLP